MKIYLWIFTGLTALYSCDENKKDVFEKIDTYPTSIGTEWTYESEIQMKIYDSLTSTKIIDGDSAFFIMRVKIEKDTVLNDTMNVIQFTSIMDNYDYPSAQYYFVNKDGLKAYAHSNTVSHSYAKKFSTGNKPINLIPLNIFDPTISGDEDFIVFKPVSRLNLKLPLELNSKWTYTTPYEPLNLQIDKEVIGYETVRIKNHSYSCYKISWIYIENKYYGDTKIFDWIAKEGLIKRQIIAGRVPFNRKPDEPFAYSQITETILLKELVLPKKSNQ